MTAGATNTWSIVRERNPPGAGLVGGVQRGEKAARPHVTWTSAVGGLIALGLSTYQLVRVLPKEARA